MWIRTETKNVKMQPDLSKLTKSQRNILWTAEKKRFCELRALRVVQACIEPVLDKDVFLDQLQYIEQSHYADITEERAVTSYCGYPLCSNRLGKIPTKQFDISTITNRIYDITERKKFCSSSCFRASRYLKPQIQTSPLWLRDEEPKPVFRLIDDEDNRRGEAGDPVELGVLRLPPDERGGPEDERGDPDQVTTDRVVTDMMAQFDELSERISELGLRPQEERDQRGGGGRGARRARTAAGNRRTVAFEEGGGERRRGGRSGAKDDGGGAETREVVESRDDAANTTEKKTDCTLSSTAAEQSVTSGDTASVPENTPVSGESCPSDNPPAPAPVSERHTDESQQEEEKRERPAPRTAAFKRPVRSPRQAQHPLVVVEARLLDWLGVKRPPAAEAAAGSATPAAGSTEVGKEAGESKDQTPAGAVSNEAGDVSLITGSANAEVCPGDPAKDVRTADPSDQAAQFAAQPHPDPAPAAAGSSVSGDAAGPAAVLSPEEAAAQNQAMLAYLRAQTRLPQTSRKPPAAAEEPTRTEEGRPVPPEPLLESQTAVRRRIVNDQLGKAMARLLSPLGLVWSDVTSPLRQLVSGFHLTAQNVTLTPPQWNLAALVLLRLLLSRSPELSALARDVQPAFESACLPLRVTVTRLDKLVRRMATTLDTPR